MVYVGYVVYMVCMSIDIFMYVYVHTYVCIYTYIYCVYNCIYSYIYSRWSYTPVLLSSGLKVPSLPPCSFQGTGVIVSVPKGSLRHTGA